MYLNKRNTYIILFSVILLIFSINLMTFKSGHNWGDDFSSYIGQAKSLVDGTVNEFVEADIFLNEHSTMDTGGLYGSWGFPLLLSPIYYFFGLDMFAMKVFVNLFFMFSLFVLFLLFKDRLSNLQNLLLIIIIAFNKWFFDFKDDILSDYPFLFFSLTSLLLIQRFVISKEIWINRFISYASIGVLIFLSSSIRPVGLVLLPTLFFIQLIEGSSGPRNILSFISDRISYVPYIIFVIFTATLTLIQPEGSATSIFRFLSTISIDRIIYDIKSYTLLPARFFPFLFIKLNVISFDYNKFSLIIYAAMLLFVFIGIKIRWKKDYLYLVYPLFTVIILMTFSRGQGFRLIIPIFPFFLYFFFIGLSTLTLSTDIFQIRADHIFGFGIILLSMVYISHTGYQNIAFNKTEVIEGPYSSDSTELFNYIKSNTDKDDPIIFYKARILPLYTGRKSFKIAYYNEIANSPARHIVCFKTGINICFFEIQKLRDNHDCMFENDTFIFCSLKKEPE